MQIKKIISLIMIVITALTAAFCFSACQTQNTVSFDYQIAYTNSTNDDIIYSGFNIENKDSKDTQTIVQELFDQMFKVNKEDTIHYSPLPQTITYNSCTVTDNIVTVDIGKGYADLTNVQQQILKSCVGLTLSQVDGIKKFTFTQDGNAITLNDGSVLDLINVNKFVEMIPSDNSVITQTRNYNIYFSNKAGNLLVLNKCTATIDNPNISAEEYIINLLKNGNNENMEDCIPTIDPETELIGISTVDGICYVNFDETFLNQTTEVSDEVMVYSIVNSLCDLSYVNSVQFLINGESDNDLHMTIDLSKPLTENTEIIQS